jgi:hypothetical protein
MTLFQDVRPRARADWLTKLQRTFMTGLRCRDVTQRGKFVELFHRHVSKGLFDRLYYILALQDWEPLSDSFWLSQALDLLLASVDDTLELGLGGHGVRVASIEYELPEGARRRRRGRAWDDDGQLGEEREGYRARLKRKRAATPASLAGLISPPRTKKQKVVRTVSPSSKPKGKKKPAKKMTAKAKKAAAAKERRE